MRTALQNLTSKRRREAEQRAKLDLPTYDPTARTATPKPGRLERDEHAHERRTDKAREKRIHDLAKMLVSSLLRRHVFTRDKSRSRFSGQPVAWSSANPLDVGHAHHIVFRSAGGSDEIFNRCLLTPHEHEMAHHRHPKWILDIEGLDANQTLVFVKRVRETGQILERTESPVP